MRDMRNLSDVPKETMMRYKHDNSLISRFDPFSNPFRPLDLLLTRCLVHSAIARPSLLDFRITVCPIEIRREVRLDTQRYVARLGTTFLGGRQ